MTVSPAPGTPQTPYKAYVSAALAAITAFVSYWIADEGAFTGKEVGTALVAALIAAGLGGGFTFAVPNKATVR